MAADDAVDQLESSRGVAGDGYDVDLTGSVPPTSGVHRLLDLLDQKILNRSRGGPVVYVVTHPDEEDFWFATVSGFGQRLVGEGESLVSHGSSAVVSFDPEGDEPDVYGFLDGLVEQLESSVPVDSKPVSFESYWMLRAAMQVEVRGRGRRHRRREIRDHLFADAVERRVSVDWFKEVAQGGPSKFVAKALFMLVARFPRVLYGFWLRRPRRTQWISEKLKSQFLIKKTDLLSTCAHLNANKGADYSALTLELLLEGLLYDLSRGRGLGRFFRKWSWRPWRTVLLFPRLGEESSPSQQICRSLVNKHERFPDHVVVIAGSRNNPSWITSKVTHRQEFRLPGDDSPAVIVELGDYDRSVQSELDTRRLIPAPLERPPFKGYVRALAWLMPVVLLSVGAFTVWRTLDRVPCRHVDEYTSESGRPEFAGITNGGCLDVADRDLTAKGILEQLEEQNKTAREEADELGISLRTVAYLAPVEGRGGGEQRQSAVLQQLQGALAQQSYVNEEIDDRSMRTQLLVVDPGYQYWHAETVIEDLVELIESDSDLTEGFIGVAGVSQSWTGAQEAIETLDNNDIAVVGAAVTGSSLSDPDTAPLNYVQVSPSNVDMAEQIINELDPTDKAIIVYHNNPDDLFSEDLKNQLKTQLNDQQDAVPERVVAEIPYKTDSGSNGLSANTAAKEICNNLTEPDTVVLYAGRSTKFVELLQQATLQPGCSQNNDQKLRLYASTDIPKLIDANGTLQSRKFLPFEIHVAQYGNVQQRIGLGVGEALCTRLQPHGIAQSSDAAQAFDAVALLLTVMREVENKNPTNEIPPNKIRLDIREHLILNEVGLAGASGNITIGKNTKKPNQTDMPITIQEVTSSQTADNTCN